MIDPSIARFEVSFPSAEIADLRARLAGARYPAALGPGGGIAQERVRALATHWQSEFDFAACARRLNAVPQFLAQTAGGTLHFLHAAADGKPPLLLLHGWPGSVVEFLPVIPLLAGSHALVAPSIPGFGWSAAAPDLSPPQMADALADLMSRLGYERFFVHGGDVGASVGTWLARRHPRRVLGLHLNYIPGSYSPYLDPALPLAPEETRFLADAAAWSEAHGAYAHLQRTRPLTLAYGLDDSPVALLAWIAEKFDLWKDPQSALSDETLLDDVTVYWFTQSAYASVRYYLESARTPHRFAAGERVLPPCGVARFPLEEPFPPRAYIDRAYDVQRFTTLPRGGHFAALEAPELLAGEIERFIAQVLAQGRAK